MAEKKKPLKKELQLILQGGVKQCRKKSIISGSIEGMLPVRTVSSPLPRSLLKLIVQVWSLKAERRREL